MTRFRSLRFRVQCVVAVLVALLVAAAGLSAREAYLRVQQAERVQAVAALSRDLYTALNTQRFERGWNYGLWMGQPMTAGQYVFETKLRRQQATELQALLPKLRAFGLRLDAATIAERLARYQSARAAADPYLRAPVELRPPQLGQNMLESGVALTIALNDAADRLGAEVPRSDPFVAQMMTVGRLAWTVRGAAGDNSIVWWAVVRPHEPLAAEELKLYDARQGAVETPWRFLKSYAKYSAMPKAVSAEIEGAETLYFDRARTMERLAIQALITGGPLPRSQEEARKLQFAGLSSLMKVTNAALDAAAAAATRRASESEGDFYAAAALAALALAGGVLVMVFMTSSILNPVRGIATAIRDVAGGDFDREIPDIGRRDEVGEVARALAVFREFALAKQRADEQLLTVRIAKETAEAAARAQAQFLSNMSHELRSPLTAVLGFAGLMSKMDALPEKARLHTQRILAGGDRLLALVNDILDIAHIEKGRLELAPEPFGLTAFLDETIDLVRPAAEAKTLSLSLLLGGPLPDDVIADRARVGQVLLNLVGNAIKYTREGAITVEARYDADEARLAIMVRDTGIGVPPELGERLFRRFSQADESDTRLYGGAGLGLAISKGLIDLMAGRIGHESRPDEGSTFWFSIPAPIATPRPAALEAGVSVDGPLALKALVVDDLPTNRELLAGLLAPFDIEVRQAGDGAEAVALASREPFDIILMDLQMPVMDGLAATRAIRRSGGPNASTPILAVSANAMPSQVQAARASGMDDHVPKPIDPADLLGKIVRWTSTESLAS